MQEININGKLYTVKENEYTKIEHIIYNNLRLYNDLDVHERIIGLIKKCKEVYSIEPDFLSFDTKYGGFIPLNLSNDFQDICLVNTSKEHKNNIENNIETLKIRNINFFNSSVTINKIIYSEALKIDSVYLKQKNSILITKEKISQKSSASVFSLSRTDYYIHVDVNLLENFTNIFRYYIEGEIDGVQSLNFDNLINLCIMVKNAGPQFEQMLTKNFNLIDRWTILDTGSTDKTIEIINRVLVGKKEGNLYEEPFINFRDSRNRLLDLAGTTCKFNIMLDDTYIVQGNLREFLTEVRSDQYSNSFTLFIHSDDTNYGSNRIIKSDSGLRYIHKIHEVITDKNNINVVIPEDKVFIIDERFDYMEKRTMERKQLDLKLLFEEVEENPNDPRAYYYLAQTYNLLEEYEKAFFYFMKRCEFINSGFIQERVDAAFEAARIANFKLNKPWNECEELYNKCFKIDESRPESLYFIGIHYYLENDFKKAFPYFKKGFEIGFPQHCQYSLKPTLSFHFLPKFLSRICYELEEYNLGLITSQFFLANNKENADDYSEMLSWYQIFQKLTIYSGEKKVNVPEKPIFCFVADGGFYPWSGTNILTNGVGGSETYIIEMARYIKQNGFFGEVIVFCNTPRENTEKFEGVKYYHLNKYYEFINTNYVHTCIVSRFSEYLPVTFKGFAENVYLVVHDLTPSGIVIPIDKKLKNVFCLTEWHVEYFTNIFPNLKHITVPFYYGIDHSKFFNNNVDTKVPYKFIYSSFPNRGLLELLTMWPKIYDFQPLATLHIYSDIYNKWSNDVEPEKMNKIKQLLELHLERNVGIHYHGWVSKSELANAWKTSSIWFYPCTFMETFCLTALEAASSKTFVIANDLAALQNTVGNRGCIIKGDPTTIEWQNEALEKIYFYLNNSNEQTKFINDNYLWAKKLSWKIQAEHLLTKYILPNTNKNIVQILETISTFKLESNNQFHILKIGAFKGNASNDCLILTINKNMKIILVEPVPSYYYELQKNYNTLFPDNNFIYLNEAISDKQEKIKIYYPSKTNNYKELPWWIEQIASSNIKHCELHSYALDLDVININAITIKNIIDCYNITFLFCLIIDTEGNDFKILMNTDFSIFKPLYIMFENIHLTSYHNPGENYNILLGYLYNFGYKIIHENESDTIVTLL